MARHSPITLGAAVIGWIVEVAVSGWENVGWGPLIGGLAGLTYSIIHYRIEDSGIYQLFEAYRDVPGYNFLDAWRMAFRTIKTWDPHLPGRHALDEERRKRKDEDDQIGAG